MGYEIDFISDTWKAIEARTKARLETLRAKNDSALGVEQTAHVRGQIAELKGLLTLALPAPAQVADE